jgi:hypothetical protein
LPLGVWFRAVVQAPTLGRGLWSRLPASPGRRAPECVTCCRWRFRGIENHDPDNNYSLRYGATAILDFDRDPRYRFLWRIPTWGLGTGQTVEIVKGVAADASDRWRYLTFAGKKGWLLPWAIKPARKKLLAIDSRARPVRLQRGAIGKRAKPGKGLPQVDIARARTRIETGRRAPRKKSQPANTKTTDRC